ncbi:MAG: aldo/keto reductase [Gammaproteobacteria bacterium]|nr:MAG: aldo/keto reductase [Gammaproteobacteria bacterium]
MNRRKFLKDAGASITLASLPLQIGAQAALGKIATRPIPSTGEPLPIVGFGSSAIFSGDDFEGAARLLDVLRDLGGKFIDTWPPAQSTLGRYARENSAHDDLFLGTNISTGNADLDLRALTTAKESQGKQTLDLIQLPRPTDIDAQWPIVQRWKEEGHARYIGIAVTGQRFFGTVESLLQNGQPDFIQINYSMMEPESGERLLPLAKDKGVAVVTNRPFLNGQYFLKVVDRELPEWAADFDCQTWAQFSLKWILANGIVNCTLTETTKLHHAIDNLSAGLGRLPDERERARMQAFIRSL